MWWITGRPVLKLGLTEHISEAGIRVYDYLATNTPATCLFIHLHVSLRAFDCADTVFWVENLERDYTYVHNHKLLDFRRATIWRTRGMFDEVGQLGSVTGTI